MRSTNQNNIGGIILQSELLPRCRRYKLRRSVVRPRITKNNANAWIVDLFHGTSRATCEFAFMKQIQTQRCAFVQFKVIVHTQNVNPLFLRLCTSQLYSLPGFTTWVVQATKTASRSVVFLQSVEDYTQHSKLADLQHFFLLKRITKDQTKTVMHHNSSPIFTKRCIVI